MKKKITVALCLAIVVAVAVAALCACGYTYNRNKHALIYLPETLPAGVEKIEIQPLSQDVKIVANQDGRDYIARGEEFRVVVYLLQNYDIGTLNVAVCDEKYQWKLWLDDPFGKRYAVSGLTVPKSGDITVEITGEPVRIDV